LEFSLLFNFFEEVAKRVHSNKLAKP